MGRFFYARQVSSLPRLTLWARPSTARVSSRGSRGFGQATALEMGSQLGSGLRLGGKGVREGLEFALGRALGPGNSGFLLLF